MYKFSLPDSFANRTVNKIILYAMQEHKDWLFSDFEIESVFGVPGAGVIWNGNRAVDLSFILPQDFVNGVVSMYKKFNVSYRLIFTNFLLQPVHLCDTYCNKLASLMNNQTCSAMVSLPMMAEFLQQRYPNIKVCWSTTTDFGVTLEQQIQKVNELSKNALVVVPYQFNNKPEILKQLKHPENIEVLVNEFCVDNCPMRRSHWQYLCSEILYEKDEKSVFSKTHCAMENSPAEEKNHIRTHRITREMLSEYEKMGITHFKSEGRGNSEKTFYTILDYFVLPQYKNEFIKFANECMQTNFAKYEPENAIVPSVSETKPAQLLQ